MYNISLDDFTVIQTIRDEIYLFTMGTPYKINSRTPVFASSGEGFYHSNLPPPRRSDHRPLLVTSSLSPEDPKPLASDSLCLNVVCVWLSPWQVTPFDPDGRYGSSYTSKEEWIRAHI
jgi:hypothetical protein